jgi:hypothetical protein
MGMSLACNVSDAPRHVNFVPSRSRKPEQQGRMISGEDDVSISEIRSSNTSAAGENNSSNSGGTKGPAKMARMRKKCTAPCY